MLEVSLVPKPHKLFYMNIRQTAYMHAEKMYKIPNFTGSFFCYRSSFL